MLTSVPDGQPRPWLEDEDKENDESEDEKAEEEYAETDPDKAAADAQKARELVGKLMASMSELDVRMEITVPGEILDSNAPEVEGRNSIWVIDAANMMQAQDMDMSPEIVFSSAGLKIDAPPVKD